MKSTKPSNGPLTPAWRRKLARQLLIWFKAEARDLPWRGTKDLYAIWVSEIMLQQTQVVTVIGYYERFLGRFPDVKSLAVADEREVLRHWEGLGYYRRARQLHLAARTVVGQHDGQFPDSYDALRALPGIGRYTAGAILSIGRGARLPILEANTIRVLSRLTAFQGAAQSTAGQKHLWVIAEAILPAKSVGDFNQALMELGSEICRPREPACEACPVKALCRAYQLDLVEQIPLAGKRMQYEEVTEIAVVVRDRGRVLLRHCQPGERWAGLWDFPRFASTSDDRDEQPPEQLESATNQLTGLQVQAGAQLATLKHGVSRFRITLYCYEATRQPGSRLPRSARTGAVRWVEIDDLSSYPLSVTGRKISKLLAKG